MRPPLPPFHEASAVKKVHFAGDAWNSHDALAGERGAAAAERDSRGVAFKLAEEGNWDILGTKPPLAPALAAVSLAAPLPVLATRGNLVSSRYER